MSLTFARRRRYATPTARCFRPCLEALDVRALPSGLGGSVSAGAQDLHVIFILKNGAEATNNHSPAPSPQRIGSFFDVFVEVDTPPNAKVHLDGPMPQDIHSFFDIWVEVD